MPGTAAGVPRRTPPPRRVRARWLGPLLLTLIAACTRGAGCESPATGRGAGAAGTPLRTAVPAASPAEPARDRRPAGTTAQPAAAEGTVVRVRDGDSIVVMRGGVGVEVRLDGIDCPELAQAFGKRAKRFTADLAFGRRVRLEDRGRDAYGRELSEVFLADGRSLNRELVAAGYAWWYRAYSKDQALEALERGARAARRGLWAADDPVPPWVFRAGLRRRPVTQAPPGTRP